jgi:putative salt-induced outer membrane protein YdiY
MLWGTASPSAGHDEPAAPVNEGWIGGISASVTAQTGTIDSFAGAIDAVAEQTFDQDWLKGRFNGVYGITRQRNQSTNDQKVQDAQGLFGDWKRTIHERLFWQTGSELSRDSIQDRMVRAALATGPGYRFWQGENDAAKEHFDGRFGVGYRYELYDPDADPGQGGRGGLDHDHFADLLAGFEYRNQIIEDRIDFTHTGTVRMPANAPDAYVVTTEVILGIPLTPQWSFRTGFFAEYVAIQPDEVNNLTTRTTVGLGYTF